MRVLVADDNMVHQAILGRMVVRLGHDVDMASNGIEVVAAVQENRYDLILLDIHMPSLNGIDAARLVRASDTRGHRPFIAALTVDAGSSTQKACLDVGMDVFLTKPIRIDVIRDLVAEAADFHTRRLSADAAPNGTAPAETTDPDWESIARLDRDVLDRFRLMMGGEDAEFAAELESDYVQDSMALCHAMRRTARHGDAEALARSAHTLKSNSLMFGAMRLAELARRMERLADEGMERPWEQLLQRIEDELDGVHAVLAGRSGEGEGEASPA